MAHLLGRKNKATASGGGHFTCSMARLPISYVLAKRTFVSVATTNSSGNFSA
jgi:hypothetical protein